MARDIKTRPNAASVEAFLDGVGNARRREDAKAVLGLMARISGKPAVMWGDAIVGFGVRDFSYADGRISQMLGFGFSPRSADLTLYMPHGFDGAADLLAAMPAIKKKGSCLHIKNLDQIDAAAFEALTRGSWTAVTESTPQ